MAARSKNQTVAVVEEHALDQVIASFVGKALVLAPPWALAGVAIGGAAGFHAEWGDSPWWAIGLLPPTCLLTALSWMFSHHRSLLRRLHATATTASCGVWFAYATDWGPFGGRLMAYATVVGGITTALTWNLSHVIRDQGDGRGEDILRQLFGEHAETVGLPGARMHTVKATAHKVMAKLHLVRGEKVAEDVQKKAPYIEAALALPPGSVTTSPDLDRADHVDVVLSDPRVMRNPIPWPGPSRPGASIAQPLRPGVFQDLEEVELVIVGSHLQVMGKTGSGKSIGCAWDTLAEIITRPDAAVFAIDLVKGEQTLGPLRPALHRFETTLAGAQQLLAAMAPELPTRTNLLAAKGLVEWEEGCGIPYWILWIEEAWKLFDKIKMEAFEDLMKALRSAGGSVVFSLQRSDHSQVPTIVRGQSSFWCFGVQTSKDADFGLSEEQSDAEARPELWSHNYPGMSYIDAPSIPRDRVAMPVRTYNWAKDTAALRAHAEQYPARNKATDSITAKLARFTDGTPAYLSQDDVPTNRGHEPLTAPATPTGLIDDTPEPDVMAEHLRTPDPDPELTARVGADDPIEDDPGDAEFDFHRTRRGKLPPDEASRALLDQIAEWADAGRAEFATRDLRPVWEHTGYSRPWIIAQVKKLIETGVIDDHEDGGYRIVRAPERT